MSRRSSPEQVRRYNAAYYAKLKAARQPKQAPGAPAQSASPGDHSRQPDSDKRNGLLFCDRCDQQLVETVEPVEARAGEPPMNLHTYRCENPRCRPGKGRKIDHGAYTHVCHPHPDPAVRIQARLPRRMDRPEVILHRRAGHWDEPLGELPADLRGAKDSKHRPVGLPRRLELGKRR